MNRHLPTRDKLIIMAAVMSAMFLVALDQTIISTALGAIVKEFNSFSSIGFIVTAYMLMTTVTVPIAGKMSDMYGRKKLLIIGVTVFTLGSFLAGRSPTIEWLIAWRALQGIGGGIITANAFTIVGDLFTPKERGKWQGLIGAVFGMSSVIGPLLGGWLTDGQQFFGMTTSWHWTFLINVPIGCLAVILLFKYCPQIKNEGEHHPDYLGAVFITIALSSLVLAVDNTETIFKTIIDNGLSLNAIKSILIATFILATAAFIRTEKHAKQPILPLNFFKNKTYSLMVTVSVLFGAAFLGAILYLTQFNQQVFGATASQAGSMLLPMVGGMMVSSITVGRLVAARGRYKIFILSGFGITALSVMALTTLQPTSQYIQEAIIMAITGIGLGMCMPILSLAVQNEFGQKDLGAATSSVQLFRGLGSTIGTAIFTGIFTVGVMQNIGNPQEIAYVNTLQKQPQAAHFINKDKEIDANTLLQINMQKQTISDGVKQAFSQMPEKSRQKVEQEFFDQQNNFSQQIVGAFTESLHHIFMTSSILMILAFSIVLFLEEKPLRDDHKAN